jgi:Fur family ferric uptake transcriptional regulator
MTTVGDPRTTAVSMLVSRGVRLTRPRRAVLDVLAHARQPLSVAEIHARLGERHVDLGSIYRTLALLCRHDIAKVADASRGTQRFELGERFTGHHHHLICQRCGMVQDFSGCVLRKPALARLEQRIRSAARFEVTGHDIRLYGVCERCATGEASL